MRFFTTFIIFIIILTFNILTESLHYVFNGDLLLTVYGKPNCEGNEEKVTIELKNNCGIKQTLRDRKCGSEFSIYQHRFPHNTPLEDISVRFTFSNGNSKRYVFKHIVSDCTNNVNIEKTFERNGNDIRCVLEDI
uniref:ZP domain-containing protein n=1 Tax=Strongyloides papillosus TaxID=174720 RepID=A0A0N5BJV9_STREA